MKDLVAPPFRVGMSGEKRLTGFSPDNEIKARGKMAFTTRYTKDTRCFLDIAEKSLACSACVLYEGIHHSPHSIRLITVQTIFSRRARKVSGEAAKRFRL
jgi:hypothetical protein